MLSPLVIQFALCPIVLLCLLWITAPYGRHHRGHWGRTLPNRLAWVLMELPALLTLPVLALSSFQSHAPVLWVPMIFWLGHYAYRTFAYPWLMRPSDKTFPALLVVFAVAFNMLNGYNNAGALEANAASSIPLLSFHAAFGAGLFLGGFFLHVHSDMLIRNLRRPGESHYRIPHGGAFRWVGNPNYLGEMIMWSGWAVMTWSLAGLAFALFTICNLLPRALSNHRWYRASFPDYPPERKALIPGIL